MFDLYLINGLKFLASTGSEISISYLVQVYNYTITPQGEMRWKAGGSAQAALLWVEDNL